MGKMKKPSDSDCKASLFHVHSEVDKFIYTGSEKTQKRKNGT
jgi:hypothetical protein